MVFVAREGVLPEGGLVHSGRGALSYTHFNPNPLTIGLCGRR